MSKLTYTDGPLIGLGIQLTPNAVAHTANMGSITYSVGLTNSDRRLAATKFVIISEPTRRAIREKVARGIAKLFYHIQAKADSRFGRGVPAIHFTVTLSGVTPDCEVDYRFVLTVDEILGTR